MDDTSDGVTSASGLDTDELEELEELFHSDDSSASPSGTRTRPGVFDGVAVYLVTLPGRDTAKHATIIETMGGRVTSNVRKSTTVIFPFTTAEPLPPGFQEIVQLSSPRLCLSSQWIVDSAAGGVRLPISCYVFPEYVSSEELRPSQSHHLLPPLPKEIFSINKSKGDRTPTPGHPPTLCKAGLTERTSIFVGDSDDDSDSQPVVGPSPTLPGCARPREEVDGKHSPMPPSVPLASPLGKPHMDETTSLHSPSRFKSGAGRGEPAPVSSADTNLNCKLNSLSPSIFQQPAASYFAQPRRILPHSESRSSRESSEEVPLSLQRKRKATSASSPSPPSRLGISIPPMKLPRLEYSSTASTPDTPIATPTTPSTGAPPVPQRPPKQQTTKPRAPVPAMMARIPKKTAPAPSAPACSMKANPIQWVREQRKRDTQAFEDRLASAKTHADRKMAAAEAAQKGTNAAPINGFRVPLPPPSTSAPPTLNESASRRGGSRESLPRSCSSVRPPPLPQKPTQPSETRRPGFKLNTKVIAPALSRGAGASSGPSWAPSPRSPAWRETGDMPVPRIVPVRKVAFQIPHSKESSPTPKGQASEGGHEEMRNGRQVMAARMSAGV